MPINEKEFIEKEKVEKILKAVKEEEYPPVNLIVLSRAQLELAKEGRTKDVGCIAQWVVELNNGDISVDTFERLCGKGYKNKIL